MRYLPKWIANRLIKKRYMRAIETLSYDIEKRMLQTLIPIDEAIAPKEIRPLIKSINRLIAYFEERSRHEQDFSANASHELRTPLAGIRLQTEVAMSTDDPVIQQKAHQNILIAVEQNERLIEQLLTLARLTADTVDLAMKKVDLSQLSAKVVAKLLIIAEAKHISLILESSDKLYILASEESISILLNNLIRNAIYYIPEGSKIEVKVAASENKILLSVTDNGPGIAPEKYSLVLRRFQKLKKNAKSGSGLGLAIVKHICDLHHATLTLSRPTKNNGLVTMVVFDKLTKNHDDI